MYIRIGLGSLLIALLVLFIFKGVHTHMQKPLIATQTTQDIVNLFAYDAASIARYTDQAILDAQKQLDAIIAIPNDKRTWLNTPYALDQLIATSDLAILRNIVAFLEMVSSDAAVRDAARAAQIKMNEFFIDVQMNQALYMAIKAYAHEAAYTHNLSRVQQFFITESLKYFERSGLNASIEVQQKLKELQKKLGELCIRFSQNIAADQSSISVASSELTGLEAEYIATLKKDGDNVVLGVDYPTYEKIQQQCSNADVRKKLSLAFSNRAYPMNESILSEIIAVRDEIAKLLGFASYAAYELDDEMVKSVDRAEAFLDKILVRATKKEKDEFAQFTQELPAGVTLTAQGQYHPWDTAYIVEQYKKKHFNLGEEKIAKYFPMETTIKGLLSIYEQFFGLSLKQIDLKGLWSNEVRTLVVYDKNTDVLLGYILLDLHPRPFKYTHACAGSIVPATIYNGKPTTEVSIVLANFPHASEGKPSLLKINDVRTFFHEFGHALHNILGRQELASMAGANVKRDFVEMPSQMLEEWLWDKEMLKMISGHYKTGEALPDDLIDTMIAIKNLSEGAALQRQISLGMLSLNCYKDGAHKDISELYNQAKQKCCPHIAIDPNGHIYASFGHLTGYGARYYGYLWSKVFALDLFNEIKKHGLLNPAIGKKYRNLIIGKGGSQNPNELLQDFLGREPNSDAFFRDLGI